MADIICTVDVVLLSLLKDELSVALLKRDKEPFEGTYALPGGYIHEQEDADAEEAAVRMLREKTGVTSPYLEQLGTFSGRSRDPRGWSLSVAYYALVDPHLFEQDSLSEVVLKPVAKLRSLPFDHRDIVSAAVSRLRTKSTYSSLPVFLCGEQFTLPELQAVYEKVMGAPINKVSFRRKMDELGLLEEIPGAMLTGKAHRPAQLYRVSDEFRSSLAVTTRPL